MWWEFFWVFSEKMTATEADRHRCRYDANSWRPASIRDTVARGSWLWRCATIALTETRFVPRAEGVTPHERSNEMVVA